MMLESIVLIVSLSAVTGELDKNCEDAANTLGKGTSLYAEKSYDDALTVLEQAEQCTKDPALLAQIRRQKGLALTALDHRGDALIAFGRAIQNNPSITLESGKHPPTAIKLFECAKQLGPQFLDDVTLRLDYTGQVEKPNWTCPVPKTSNSPTNADASKKGSAVDVHAGVASTAQRPTPGTSQPREKEAKKGGELSITPPGSTGQPPKKPVTEVHATPPRPTSARTWLTLTGLGVGVAGASVAVVYTLQATSKNADSKALCAEGDETACTPEGLSLREDARTAGNIATVGGVVAGVGLAGALATWLFLPDSDDDAHLSLSIGPSSVLVRGTW